MTRLNCTDMIGRVYRTNFSGDCFLIDVKNSMDMTVMFYDGFVAKVSKGNLDKGKVHNPFYIENRLFGVGVYDVGRVKTDFVGKKVRNMWYNMLERCYCKKFHVIQPTYQDVEVSEDWRLFSKFETDVMQMKNFHKVVEEGWHLDKDSVCVGNKLYSLENCCFIPQKLNSVLSTLQNLSKGDVGVSKLPHGTYRVVVGGIGKYGHVGCYSTFNEAVKVYKEVKGRKILELLREYEAVLDSRVKLSIESYIYNHVPSLINL